MAITKTGIIVSENSTFGDADDKDFYVEGGSLGNKTITATGLTAETTYYTKAYVVQDGQTIESTVEEFTTASTAVNDYFYMKNEYGGDAVFSSSSPISGKYMEYSLDRENWVSFDNAISVTVPQGGRVYLRSNDGLGLADSVNKYMNFHMDQPYSVGGDATSLIDYTNRNTTIPDYAFVCLFLGDYKLNDASELTLPTSVGYYCCYGMFKDCGSLTSAPVLPATTLDVRCYSQMFQGCTRLTTAPALPATTLAAHCYLNMFMNCVRLTTAPALPATTLAERCYTTMFYGCTSLTTAPALPATTLAEYCYLNMFQSCINLTTAPALPATTLVANCYYSMFYGCTSLRVAPALPATTLAESCYKEMFYGCSDLTTAPALPATTLVKECYYNMFYGCSYLSEITCLATDISATRCTYGWVRSVPESGTFIKHPNMTSWTSGVDGIPSGWTVVDYTE